MEAAAVGILESRNDRFINDAISSLGGIPIEFMSLSGERVPVQYGYRVVVDRLSFKHSLLREVMKSLSIT